MKRYFVEDKWIRITAHTTDGHMLQDNFHSSIWTSKMAIDYLLKGYWADKDIAEIKTEEITTYRSMS